MIPSVSLEACAGPVVEHKGILSQGPLRRNEREPRRCHCSESGEYCLFSPPGSS